jgi:hypothetical protein
MGGPMAGAAHDAKASIEGVDLLPSGDRDGALGRGARGAGNGVEWGGVGEREKRVREAGKATNELVQLQHSSVLLLQFARLPSQMQPVALFAAALAALAALAIVQCSVQCSPSLRLPQSGVQRRLLCTTPSLPLSFLSADCYVPRKMAVAAPPPP